MILAALTLVIYSQAHMRASAEHLGQSSDSHLNEKKPKFKRFESSSSTSISPPMSKFFLSRSKSSP